MAENEITAKIERTGFLVPCEPDKFGDFLSSLLKTPKKISNSSNIIFSITKDDILDFFYLIEQRIEDQQKFTRVGFNIQLTYEKGHTIELGSLTEFTSYGDVRKDKCIAINFELTYLVQMPKDDVPRKQVIELRFSTESGMHYSDTERMKYSIEIGSHRARPITNGVSYCIQHSNTTWGYDLAKVLDDKIETIAIKDKYSEFITGNVETVITLGVVISVFALLVGKVTPIISRMFFTGSESLEELFKNGTAALASSSSLIFVVLAVSVSTLVGVTVTNWLGSGPIKYGDFQGA